MEQRNEGQHIVTKAAGIGLERGIARGVKRAVKAHGMQERIGEDMLVLCG